MPNLVGIGNSQVPTNAMLGGLAYQDPAHTVLKNVDIENISKIKTSLDSYSSAHLFIYDTRKDADGGAWRKRCQHTSWYNEQLGTYMRGNRREFPCVAIIQVRYTTGYEIVIYDADQPDCPMWMRFPAWNLDGASNRNVMYGSANPQKPQMLNAMLVTGSQMTNFWMVAIDFLRDDILGIRNNSSQYKYYKGSNSIALRDSATSDSTLWWSGNSGDNAHWDGFVTGSLVSNWVKDIAMTVRPNARVPKATGLPMPTIYCATSLGITIINGPGLPGGTVTYNSASGALDYSHTNSITITDEGFVWWTGDRYDPAGGSSYYSAFRDTYAVSMKHLDTLSSNKQWNNGTDTMTSGTEGVDYYALTTGAESGNIQIGYASVYHMKILRRNMAGGENGLSLHKAPVTNFKDKDSASYLLTSDNMRALHATISKDFNTGWCPGYMEGAWVCDGETSTLTTGTDNVLDRSGPNGRSLNTVGSVPREKVATGADLSCIVLDASSSNRVQKSGWGSTINMGNPAHYTIAAWVKTTNTSSYQYMVGIDDDTTGVSSGIAIETGTGQPYFHDSTNSDWSQWKGPNTVADGAWHQVVGVLDSNGNRKCLYVDGALVASATIANVNLSSVSHIALGHYSTDNGATNSYRLNGRLALCKLSETAITHQQVKEMYEDEKQLFKENAKAFIYGSSNDVKAIDYDEDTKIYHVGTSSGRSEFRGLNRINNTTTAISYTIAASNGMVVEE